MTLIPADFETPAELAAAPGRTIVYKHSATCSLCWWSVRQVRRFAEAEGVTVHQVDVRAQRPLSQAIESHYGVRHESPQVLIIEDGRVLWHGSHRALSAERLSAALAGADVESGARL
jgi:bacillithiol system protein YtxJ